VYVEVPPLNEVVVLSVELPPLLIEVGDTLMTGAVNARLTVTRSVAEVALAAGVPVEASFTV
jgi:hypothetical protein